MSAEDDKPHSYHHGPRTHPHCESAMRLGHCPFLSVLLWMTTFFSILFLSSGQCKLALYTVI